MDADEGRVGAVVATPGVGQGKACLHPGWSGGSSGAEGRLGHEETERGGVAVQEVLLSHRPQLAVTEETGDGDGAQLLLHQQGLQLVQATLRLALPVHMELS